MADDAEDDARSSEDEVTDEQFDADRAEAAELLAGDGVDGFFAGVVRDGSLDYAFGHRVGDHATVGTQALALAAKHLQAIANEADVPVQQVADDAASFAVAFEDGE